MKKIFILSMLLSCLTVVANSTITNPQQQEIRELGRVVRSKEDQIPDPTSGVNSAGIWKKIIILRVELLEKNSGERMVYKKVIGYTSPTTGSRINKYDNQTQLLLQKQYGGYFSEYEY